MGIMTFLVLVQSAITLAHWVVFRSMDHYLGFEGVFEYQAFWLFFILSFTFLLSNIGTRVAPNFLTRTLYHYAALWLGTLHLLFLGSVVVALLELCSGFLAVDMPSWVPRGIYGAAVVLSILSLRQARQIVVAKHTVSLQHLPKHWEGKRIVFFADTHYGNIHRREQAERLVTLIEAQRPDLIFMGGDFFDGPPLQPELVTAPYQRLTISTPTFFVSGNHEEYGKKAEFLQALQMSGFQIINDQKVLMDGLQIVGLDFMTTRTEAATAMTMKHLDLDPSLPTIVLKHIPRHVEMIAALGGHLMLSGHTHQGQMWPVNLITSFIYHGFDFGLKRFKNLQVYTTSGAGSWGPPQRFLTQSEIAILTLTAKG